MTALISKPNRNLTVSNLLLVIGFIIVPFIARYEYLALFATSSLEESQKNLTSFFLLLGVACVMFGASLKIGRIEGKEEPNKADLVMMLLGASMILISIYLNTL